MTANPGMADGFDLVMPFTVCRSQDGPYDDVPFVAGYECGLIDGLLTGAVSMLSRYVRTDSVPQIDLLAMRHGYHVRTASRSDDLEWTWVELTKLPTPVGA